jgi:hypothetical protein
VASASATIAAPSNGASAIANLTPQIGRHRCLHIGRGVGERDYRGAIQRGLGDCEF